MAVLGYAFTATRLQGPGAWVQLTRHEHFYTVSRLPYGCTSSLCGMISYGVLMQTRKTQLSAHFSGVRCCLSDSPVVIPYS